MTVWHRAARAVACSTIAVLASCRGGHPRSAELILTNAHVYTFRWSDPAPDGTPARDAPYDSAGGWHPDASAIAMHDGHVVYVGSNDSALAYRGDSTRVIDLGGQTVIPGLVDAHVHVAEFGARLLELDSTRALGATLATDLGGSPRAMPAPVGRQAEPDVNQIELQLRRGLGAMAAAGYTAVHEADIDAREMLALEQLAKPATPDNPGKPGKPDGAIGLPIRVYGMLAARDSGLLIKWFRRGADSTSSAPLTIRAIAVAANGALAGPIVGNSAQSPSREPAAASAYDSLELAELMKHQFQLVVEATSAAAVGGTLDFVQRVMATNAVAAHSRVRIEGASTVSPEDIPRFIMVGVIVTIDPARAFPGRETTESPRAADRSGSVEPWRSLRMANARIALGTDLPEFDGDYFSVLHAAITRQPKQGGATGGSHPEQALTVEEVIRASTTWAAYAAYDERDAGTITPGMRGDLTVLTIDPMRVARTDADRLFAGHVMMTIVAGKVVFRAR